MNSRTTSSLHEEDAGSIAGEDIDDVYRKIGRQILPILFFAYLFAFLDRINVGYAQLEMKRTLGFSDAVYGFGAGAFFVTYLLLEIPSNYGWHAWVHGRRFYASWGFGD